MNKKYVVRLEAGERERLEKLVSVGKAAARKLTHARIRLQADESEGGPGWANRQIGEGLSVGIRTIEGLRQRFVEQGLEAALERKKRAEPPVPRKLDGEQEARLVAVCCSQAPEGRRRWTLHLLADRLVELRIIDSISYETVRQTLLKTS